MSCSIEFGACGAGLPADASSCTRRRCVGALTCALLVLALCCAFSASCAASRLGRAAGRLGQRLRFRPALSGSISRSPLFPVTRPQGQTLHGSSVDGGQRRREHPLSRSTGRLASPTGAGSDVPASCRAEFTDAGGVPTKFGPIDQLVGLAACHGLTVLPTILDAPGWDGLRYEGTLTRSRRPTGRTRPSSRRWCSVTVRAARSGQSQPRIVPISSGRSGTS